VVLVHDAARPLVTREIVERTLAAASRGLSAVAGIPPVDTIKVVDRDGLVRGTPERASLRSAQTPQAFPRAVLDEAHRRAAAEGVTATDDAALVERYGGDVVVVEGSPENLKVTGPFDLRLAEAILQARGV
jgi:2-C-methyl-D-erythritol 4-phosphate cytidylyltransferase